MCSLSAQHLLNEQWKRGWALHLCHLWYLEEKRGMLSLTFVLPVVLSEMAHLVSSGDGLVVTVDRESGRGRCVVYTVGTLDTSGWYVRVERSGCFCVSRCVFAFQVTSCGVRTMDLLLSGSICTRVTHSGTPPTCPSPWKLCAFSPSPLPTSRPTHTPHWNGATSLWRSKQLHKPNSCKKKLSNSAVICCCC